MIDAGGRLSGAGTVNSALTNNGIIIADRGLLELNGAISGSGTIATDPSTTLLELNAPTAQNISFADNNGGLRLDTPSTFTGAVAPSGAGDRITIPNVALSSDTSTSYVGGVSGGTLTLQQGAGASTAIRFIGNYDATRFFLSAGQQVLSSDPPSLEITVDRAPVVVPPRVCFCRGTRILTLAGERSVEALRPGDQIVTWRGETKTIIWIGSGSMLVSASEPCSRPVIICAGALADGVPSRDLRVTQGHSLFLDGVLIPVSALINGGSIRWDGEAKSVAFYHAELLDHDVLVADGAPAESYRNDGNRILISGSHDAGAAGKPPVAPVIAEGPLVDAIWATLAARAKLGSVTTGEPDLHLVVDVVRIESTAVEGSQYRFELGGRPQQAAICSRAVVPALAGTARDHRRLGVAIREVRITSGSQTLLIDYASDLLVSASKSSSMATGCAGQMDMGSCP